MLERKFSKEYHLVAQKDVWERSIDIDRWPEWHGDLDFCELQGDFAPGAFFMLKPKGMRVVRIDITEVDPGRSFTDCTRFPGARMFNTHTVEPSLNGVKISNRLHIDGPLRWLWYVLVGRNVAKSIPEETELLVSRVREAQHG